MSCSAINYVKNQVGSFPNQCKFPSGWLVKQLVMLQRIQSYCFNTLFYFIFIWRGVGIFFCQLLTCTQFLYSFLLYKVNQC